MVLTARYRVVLRGYCVKSWLSGRCQEEKGVTSAGNVCAVL